MLEDLGAPDSLLFDNGDGTPNQQPDPGTRVGECPPGVAVTPGAGGKALRELRSSSRAPQFDSLLSPLGVVQRRREPRYRAIEDQVWVQWWHEGEFSGLSGRMINVSRGGAMIVIGVRLRDGQVLSMMLENSASEVSVESAVRGTTPSRGGVFQTRLEFLTECPDAFFDAAASGFEAWLTGSRGSR